MVLTIYDLTTDLCAGDYTSASSYHQPVPGYHSGGGCDQLLASQSLMTSAPASADLHYPSGQTQEGPVIKTEAEHIGDHCGLETETEESGEESEAEDRLKTEAEGGKEASNTKPPFSYVAMIGESSDAKEGLFLKSQ